MSEADKLSIGEIRRRNLIILKSMEEYNISQDHIFDIRSNDLAEIDERGIIVIDYSFKDISPPEERIEKAIKMQEKLRRAGATYSEKNKEKAREHLRKGRDYQQNLLNRL